MADLLEIFSTLFQFFAFVLLATVVACLPAVVFLWFSELADHSRAGHRARRRSVIPLAKVA